MNNKDDFMAETILNIVRASNLLIRLGGNYAQDANLTSVQQYMILAELSKNDHLSMGDLRSNTLVTKQAVTGLVKRLRNDGYIETYRDSNDRRITRVCLTNKGRDALKLTRPNRIKGNRETFSVLSNKEIKQLSEIISKLIEQMDR